MKSKLSSFSFLFSFRSAPSFFVLLFLLSSCTKLLVGGGLFYERNQSDVERKEIQAAGYHWTYLEGGRGETIVLVHGFGGDKDNWTRFVRTLTPSYHVIIPDLPGFGENERKPEDEYSILTQVSRLNEFTKAIGLEKFHIIGNSMGGSISGVFSATYPERVLTLALVDSAGVKSPISSELGTYLAQGKNPLVAKNEEDFDFLMKFIFVKPPYIPGFLKSYFSDKAIANRDFNAKIYSEIKSQPNVLEEKLGSIRTRTWIVWGDTDRVIHISASDVMLKGIKNAKRTILKDCGHSPQLERPTEVAELYQKFLKEE
ncbi:alpha/beta hydrolase [Leptospira sp. FAT2]|uniref:alpha/beta fold hydrolase n=1 Tax=Leptospira sanjuanensis TaxID=2879643 RepID=UPI001EE90566|nr:alpha/beta hydrolase [Leptospira sanjuanensis]MCG6193709.1 alpha/beta hydrolase [Leptospira sanjuanensis]